MSQGARHPYAMPQLETAIVPRPAPQVHKYLDLRPRTNSQMPPKKRSSKGKKEPTSVVSIPAEILRLVFQKLPQDDRVIAGATCRLWHACSLDPSLWTDLTLACGEADFVEERLDAFVSWLIPRKDQVQRLELDLSCVEEADAESTTSHIIAVLAAVSPTLTQLSLTLAQNMRLTLAAWAGSLRQLRSAAFTAAGLEVRPGLSKLRTLESLELSLWGEDSQLELPNEGCLPLSLTHLSLKECNLEVVPLAVTRLSKLVSLDLSENPLHAGEEWVEHATMSTLEALTQLRVLNMSNCGLENLPRAVESLQELRMLSFSGNLTAADDSSLFENTSLEDTLAALTNLEVLDLSGCRVEGLLGGGGPPSLRAVALHSNEGFGLSEAVGALPHLSWLSMDFCKAFDLESVGALEAASELQTLVLVCGLEEPLAGVALVPQRTVTAPPGGNADQLQAMLCAHPSLRSIVIVDEWEAEEGNKEGEGGAGGAAGGGGGSASATYDTATLRLLLTLAQQPRIRVSVEGAVEVPVPAEFAA